jgi:hypothetical protein
LEERLNQAKTAVKRNVAPRILEEEDSKINYPNSDD